MRKKNFINLKEKVQKVVVKKIKGHHTFFLHHYKHGYVNLK